MRVEALSEVVGVERAASAPATREQIERLLQESEAASERRGSWTLTSYDEQIDERLPARLKWATTPAARERAASKVLASCPGAPCRCRRRRRCD